METKIYRTIIGLAIVISAAYVIYWNLSPQIDEQYLSSSIPPELENQVFHWRYDVGWDFRVQMQNDQIHWEGLEPPFEGWAVTVEPHFTKVREGLYFITWNIPFTGYDSIVLDIENERVFAHSKANAKFAEISGEVHCNGLKETCEPPRRE